MCLLATHHLKALRHDVDVGAATAHGALDLLEEAHEVIHKFLECLQHIL